VKAALGVRDVPNKHFANASYEKKARLFPGW
jgi:hypothetical protein